MKQKSLYGKTVLTICVSVALGIAFGGLLLLGGRLSMQHRWKKARTELISLLAETEEAEVRQGGDKQTLSGAALDGLADALGAQKPEVASDGETETNSRTVYLTMQDTTYSFTPADGGKTDICIHWSDLYRYFTVEGLDFGIFSGLFPAA